VNERFRLPDRVHRTLSLLTSVEQSNTETFRKQFKTFFFSPRWAENSALYDYTFAIDFFLSARVSTISKKHIAVEIHTTIDNKLQVGSMDTGHFVWPFCSIAAN